METQPETDLPDIDAAVNDYASTAAKDSTTTATNAQTSRRTLQTDEDFEAIRAEYSAKIDDGNVSHLLLFLSLFRS